MTLVEFLRARLDEDEQVARAAQPGPWMAYASRGGGSTVEGPDARGVAHRRGYDENSPFPDSDPLALPDAAHIARHDPARVLAEVAAKRGIVQLHAPVRNALTVSEGGGHYLACITCPHAEIDVPHVLECETLRLLALPHAEHPDYREEWKP